MGLGILGFALRGGRVYCLGFRVWGSEFRRDDNKRPCK